MKKIILAFALALSAASLIFAESPFFSADSGILVTAHNKRNHTEANPTLSGRSYVNGQFSLSNSLIFRTEFYFAGENIFEKNKFAFGNASFQAQSISLTCMTDFLSKKNFLTLYYGEFEPFGSDIFFRNHFSERGFNSNLEGGFHGLEEHSMFRHYGPGLAYTVHTTERTAFSLSVFDDISDEISIAEDDIHVVSGNARLTGSMKYLSWDMTAGIGFPFADKGEKDYEPNGKNIVLHGGIKATIGYFNTPALYIQTGFSNLAKNTDDYIQDGRDHLSHKNIYFLAEARLDTERFLLSAGGFNFPRKNAEEFMYMQNPVFINPDAENFLGLNFQLILKNISVGNAVLETGIINTISCTNSDMDEFYNEGEKGAAFVLTPMTKLSFNGFDLVGFANVNTRELICRSYRNVLFVSFGFKGSF